MENKQLREKLLKAYNRFFLGENTFENIMNQIEQKIDLNEFGRLMLSNINLIHEIMPEFIWLEFRRSFEAVFLGGEVEEVYRDELSTYKEFKEALNKRVVREVVTKAWKT